MKKFDEYADPKSKHPRDSDTFEGYSHDTSGAHPH